MRRLNSRISGGGSCFQGGKLFGGRRRLAPPERLEVRAAPGGGVAGLMVLGGWYAWPEDPDDKADLWHMLAPDDLLFTVTASDGSTMSFAVSKSGDNLETSLFTSDWTAAGAEPERTSDGGLDPYRALAVEQIGKATDRLLGEGFDTSSLWDSPAVEQFAAMLASGTVRSMQAGAAPAVSTERSDAATGSQPAATSSSVPGMGDENTPPEAGNDFFTGIHDWPLYGNVILNDVDFEGDPLTASLDSGPTHADVFFLSSDGNFTHEPTVGFVGEDSFTYHVNDGEYDSNVATVTITFWNLPPEANPDGPQGYSTGHNEPLAKPAPGVLSNDIDSDFDPIWAVLDGASSGGDTSAGGTVALNSDGSIYYTPPVDWAGTDTFTYHATDGLADSPSTTVTIPVTNVPPEVGSDGWYTVETGETITIDPVGVRANDYDLDDEEFTLSVRSGPYHGALTDFDADLNFDGEGDGGFSYTADPGYAGPDSFTYYADDGYDESMGDATVSIQVVPKVDLDARTIYRNLSAGTLPDAYEESPGAYVPHNNDDDDYDASNTPDYQQAGAILGENDLLPIVLRAVEPVALGGTHTLNFSNDIRVWQNSDRTGAVTSDVTTFDATVQTTVYVEAVVAQGSVPVTLNWQDGALALSDRVVVKIFGWEGPLNVPGHSIYNYQATGGMAGAGNSMWIAPLAGTLHSSSPGDTVDEAEILWNGGPAVGMALYQAQANYIWGLDVNVVEIKIRNDTTNKLAYGGPPSQFPGTALIPSSATGKAMEIDLTVERIEGAPRAHVGGARRGVKFMQMGFVQNCTLTREHGLFTAFNPDRKRVASLEGHSGLDTVGTTGGEIVSIIPWADVNDYTGFEGFFGPVSDATVHDHAFNVSDTPRIIATDTPVLSGDGIVDSPVNSYQIEMDFNMYFAVCTTDVPDGPGNIYTQRAVASWEFDGTGDVTGAGVGNYGVWTSTGNGNTGSTSSTIVTNGARVPYTTGPTFNDLLATRTWSTDPPF